MKLGIILSTNNEEINWNAFRLANLAIGKGDIVSVFLTGEGVEYGKNSSDKFNVSKQVEKFLKSPNATIIACGTCMMTRNQKGSRECPEGGIEDFYRLIVENDKVITF